MEEVTIENYTECCLRTWGSDNQKERAELGIIGELGEVAEVLKKFLRGDFDKVERDKRLLKELGDATYYFFIKYYLDGMQCNLESECECYDPCIDEAIQVYSFYTDAHLMHGIIQRLYACNWESIYMLMELMRRYGVDLVYVMQANIDKLSKRAENGLIKGDGDNRGE